MTTDNQPKAGDQQQAAGAKPETVSLEEFNAQKAKLEKLEKIFEERQTKALDKEFAIKKEDVLKALGIEADPKKTENEILLEQIQGLTTSVKDLQTKLADAETEKARHQKESKAKDLAAKQGFADPSDALKFINLDSESLENDLKALADSKPYLLGKKPEIPGANPAGSGNIPKDIDQQIADAIKKGDVAKSIALKNQKFGYTN